MKWILPLAMLISGFSLGASVSNATAIRANNTTREALVVIGQWKTAYELCKNGKPL